MAKNRTSIKTAVLVAVAILIAYFMRFLPLQPHQTLLTSAAMMVRYVIHVTLLICWCASIHRRIMNTQVRHLLMAVGALMTFWLTVRTMKYEFVADTTHPSLRYLWYCYYIPMVLIPAIGMFILCFMGKPEDYRLPKKMYSLLIPAGLLMGSVLSNDLHQLVFRFHKGIELFDKEYSYGFLYYIVMAWFIILGLIFVIGLLRKSRVPGSKKMQKLPLIIMLAAVAFWIGYSVFHFKVDLTAVDNLIIACLLESAIQCGMISANNHYGELFEVTTVPVLITDKAYEPCYCSDSALLSIPKETLCRTEEGTVQMANILLDSAPVNNGYTVWQTDVSRENALKEHLDAVCEQLSEENTLLQAEFELKEQQAKTDEKNRLYDRIALEVSAQLDRIHSLLMLSKEDPERSKHYMAKVCVMGAYIKRRGNLVLLGENQTCIHSKELEYCLLESADNLNLCGICTAFHCGQSGSFSVETAITAYDFFQSVLQWLFDDLTAVMIHLSCKDDRVAMRLQLGCAKPIGQTALAELSLPNGQFSCQLQEEDLIIDLTVSEGGDRG